jgi:hypothetical protein
MKRIKLIATLCIMFSASLMNYHDHSTASVNFFNGSETVETGSTNSCKNDSPAKPLCKASGNNACSHSDIRNSDKEQIISSGKNYEATMVIM